MGRYYHGDIEGKFWFGVQSSDAADRFGSIGHQTYISYYFEKEEHLDLIQKELKLIMETIGEENFKIIESFFSRVNGYNDKIMQENNLDPKLWNKHKVDYADYLLGKKIEEQLLEYDSCSFEAEI